MTRSTRFRNVPLAAGVVLLNALFSLSFAHAQPSTDNNGGDTSANPPAKESPVQSPDTRGAAPVNSDKGGRRAGNATQPKAGKTATPPGSGPGRTGLCDGS